MHDRDDDEESPLPASSNPQAVDPAKDFPSQLLLFRRTVDRIAEDRNFLALTTADFVEKFDALLKKFEAMGTGLNKKWEELFQQESRRFAQTVANEVNKTISTETEKTVTSNLRSLSNAIVSTGIKLNEYASKAKDTRWKFLLVALAAAILGGLAGGTLVNRAFPPQALTEAQWNQMESGKILQKAWKGLTKKEQDKIMELGQ